MFGAWNRLWAFNNWSATQIVAAAVTIRCSAFSHTGPSEKLHMLTCSPTDKEQLTWNAPELFPSPIFGSGLSSARLKTERHVSRQIAFVLNDARKKAPEQVAVPAFAFQLVFLPTIRYGSGSEIRYLDPGWPRSLSFGELLFQGLEASAQPKVEKPKQKLGSNLLSRMRGSSVLVCGPWSFFESC
jgi:hypothetical protein